MNKPYGWIRETPDAGTMKPGDRYAMWAIIAVLVALVAMNVVSSVQRVIEIAAGPPLTVELPVDIPLSGAEGAATYAEFTLTWIDGAERTWLIAHQVADSLSWILLIGCLAVFFAYIARRTPFPPRLPIILSAGGIAYLVFQGGSLMARGAATRALTARLDLDSFALDVDFLRVFVLPVVLISVAYVLGAGRRIQKDTEGLV